MVGTIISVTVQHKGSLEKLALSVTRLNGAARISVTLVQAGRLGRGDIARGIGLKVILATAARHAISISAGAVTSVHSVSQGNLATSGVRRSSLAAVVGRSTVVVKGHDLSRDATGIRRTADLGNDGANGINQLDLGLERTVLQSSLNNIVAVIVLQKTFGLAGNQHLLDHHVLGLIRGATKTLLHDVGTELVTGQSADTAEELQNQRLSEAGLIQINDVLNDIIAKGVLNEASSVLRDAVDESDLLITSSMINAALKDAATVAMSSDVDAVIADGLKDELVVFRR